MWLTANAGFIFVVIVFEQCNHEEKPSHRPTPGRQHLQKKQTPMMAYDNQYFNPRELITLEKNESQDFPPVPFQQVPFWGT